MAGPTQNGSLKKDDNDYPVMGGTSSVDNATIINSAFDPVTRRLLTDNSSGSGTVTEVDTGTGLTGGPITTTGTVSLDSKLAPLDTLGTAGQLIRVNAGATALEYFTQASGGSVTTVSVVTNQGVSGSVANPTTTPAITLSLGALTGVTSFNGLVVTANTGAITTGVWNGTTIAIANGGTGQTTAAAAFNALSPMTTGGDLIYGGASGAGTRLANGSAGQVLTSGGTTVAPTWQTPTTGTVTAVSIATANGFSGSSSGGATPALTIVAGAIVPNTVVASDATTPHVDTTAGSTNTGYFLVNGKTSGSLKLTTADATAQAVTLTAAAQTTGAATLTIPDMAGANKTIAWLQSPSFTTPTLGVATATTINKVTLTAPATGSTLTIADGKTLTVSHTMQLTAADDTGVYTFPTGTNTLVATTVTTLSSLTSTGTITTGGLGTGATLGAVTVNIASTAVGDLFYAGGSNVLTRLADVAAGQPLLSGGVTTAPAYAGYTFSATAAQTYTFPGATATLAGLGTTQTFTGQDKFNNIIDVNNAVTVTSNAGTVPVTFRLNTFTNSSAATMAITMATASAVDGQMTIVRIYDFSGVAQTIGWTNTENSTVSVPTTSNGSTTLPLTVGFMYNSQTSKWRCIASC